MRYETLKSEYARLWDQMEIVPRLAHEVDQAAQRILAGKQHYCDVEVRTRVPWWVVGIIHDLEGSCNFAKHLHNGDSLAARTHQVPKGRPPPPLQPPFKWEDSACDALAIDGLDKIDHWTVERFAFAMETYNGAGYRMHPQWGVDSPYLWSYSNLYIKGKYRSDGSYDPNLVSAQPGAMVLLRMLMELDPSIAPPRELAEAAVIIRAPGTDQADPWAPTVLPAGGPAFPKAVNTTAGVLSVLPSRRLWGTIIALLGALAQLCRDWINQIIDGVSITFGALPSITGEVKETLDAGELVAGWLKLNWPDMVLGISVATLLFVAVRHIRDERNKPKLAPPAPSVENANAH